MFRFLLEKINLAAFLKAAKTPFASVSLHSQKLHHPLRLDDYLLIGLHKAFVRIKAKQ